MSKTPARAQARGEKLKAMRAEDRRRSMRRKNITISLTVIGVFVVVLGAVFAINRFGSGSDTAVAAAGESQLVRADSHRVQTAADGKVTLVEFLDFECLDFECEACRAAFPVVEELRKEYAGRVTFVVRYFPVPSHFNAERAARAVEAGGRSVSELHPSKRRPLVALPS